MGHVPTLRVCQSAPPGIHLLDPVVDHEKGSCHLGQVAEMGRLDASHYCIVTPTS